MVGIVVISIDVGLKVVVANLNLSFLSDPALPIFGIFPRILLIRSFHVCGIQYAKLSGALGIVCCTMRHMLGSNVDISLPGLQSLPMMKHSQSLIRANETSEMQKHQRLYDTVSISPRY